MRPRESDVCARDCDFSSGMCECSLSPLEVGVCDEVVFAIPSAVLTASGSEGIISAWSTVADHAPLCLVRKVKFLSLNEQKNVGGCWWKMCNFAGVWLAVLIL